MDFVYCSCVLLFGVKWWRWIILSVLGDRSGYHKKSAQDVCQFWFLFLISCIFSSISLPQPNNPHPSPPWTILCPLSSNLIFIVAPSCTSLNVCRCTLCHEGVQYNTSLSLRGTYAKSKSPSIEYPREDIPYHGQRTTYRATHHQPPTSPLNNGRASPATRQLLRDQKNVKLLQEISIK